MLAYGGTLGLGLTTRILFGAFYVLCALSILTGEVGYGALLMGTYGAARALALLPASWGAYRHRGAVAEWLASSPYFDLGRAQRALAVALTAFGAQVLVASALATTGLAVGAIPGGSPGQRCPWAPASCWWESHGTDVERLARSCRESIPPQTRRTARY